MTDQYGRRARPGRVVAVAVAVAVLTVAVLSALVGGTTAAAAVPGLRTTPTPTPAVRTTPAVQERLTLADKRIAQPTGLALSSLHPGVMWMVSGKTLFAVQASGRTAAAYTFSGPAPLDFEALAITKDERGHPMLLLGDTGDPHRSRRKGAWLYMVREPDRLGNAVLRPQRYQIEFPDGPQDVRSLLVDPSDQRVYLVSLTSTGGNVYALPAALGLGMSNLLTKVNPVHFVAQDGGFLPDGRVILRGKNQAHLLEGIGGKRMAYLQMPRQADGPVAVLPGGTSILVAGTAPGRIWRLRIPDLPAPARTPGPGDAPTAGPAAPLSTGSLSSQAIGIASLAGIFVIAIFGAVLHLRRRSGARAARRPPE